MTTRLYCRDCGWHPAYRRQRAALRAATGHHCTTTPLAQTSPRWWSWSRVWAYLCGTSPTDSTPAAMVGSRTTQSATEFVDARGNRIQWAVLAAHHADTTRRARQAMVELVRAGYQIGPPPYGYRALRIRVTNPTGHSKLRTVLVPDWQTAAVAKQIFTWRVDHGLSIATIATRLNNDHGQYPPPAHAGRWSAQTIRRIITNPKYVGRQVWARTTAGRPAPVEQWITSAPRVHEPLIDERTFHRAQPSTVQHPSGSGSTDSAESPPSPT